jgi:hypothetical protein
LKGVHALPLGFGKGFSQGATSAIAVAKCGTWLAVLQKNGSARSATLG